MLLRRKPVNKEQKFLFVIEKFKTGNLKQFANNFRIEGTLTELVVFRSMKKFSFCFIILFLTFGHSFAQTKRKLNRPASKPVAKAEFTAESQLTELQKRRLESFNIVWQTIKDNYFDQTFSGLNWEKIKLEYKPLVLSAATDVQFHQILQKMINRLNRSHFAIIPPEVYEEIENTKLQASLREESQNGSDMDEDSGEENQSEKFELEPLSKYGIGIDLRLINNQLIITRIEKNSAAEKAGLKLGFAVEKINGVSLKELLEKLEIWETDKKSVKHFLPLQLVNYIFNSELDDEIALTIYDEKNQSKEIKIKREKIKGETITIGKHFPEQFLTFEAESIDEKVGYIRFNLFTVQIIEKFCSALTELKDKQTIIIDLRGNTGGLIGALYGISGMLTDSTLELGTQIYKVGSEKLVAETKAKNFKGNLIVLVDNLSVSSAEILAAALQENNRAVIVGEKSAGQALPSITAVLPTGAVLIYPIANFQTPKGNFLEGKGVEPNIPVILDRNALLNGVDNQLDAALKFSRDKAALPKQTLKESGAIVKSETAQPPPAQKTSETPKILGEVKISTKVRVPKIIIPKTGVKDIKSQQLIANFIKQIGGEEELKKIQSYTANGLSEFSVRGSEHTGGISIYRQKPNQYSEIMRLESLGEIREVYNDNNLLIQTDFGITRSFDLVNNSAKVELFAPIFNLLDAEYFKELKYQGAFDRFGKKAHLIEAVTKDNSTVALAFDFESGRLVSYATMVSNIAFDDYNAVEKIQLPFSISRDNMTKIQLYEVKLNTKIDESNFVKKINCFDKTN